MANKRRLPLTASQTAQKPLTSKIAQHRQFIDSEIRNASKEAAFKILERVSRDGFEVFPRVEIFNGPRTIKAHVTIVVKLDDIDQGSEENKEAS
jgi:hypothetical protein